MKREGFRAQTGQGMTSCLLAMACLNACFKAACSSFMSDLYEEFHLHALCCCNPAGWFFPGNASARSTALHVAALLGYAPIARAILTHYVSLLGGLSAAAAVFLLILFSKYTALDLDVNAMRCCSSPVQHAVLQACICFVCNQH